MIKKTKGVYKVFSKLGNCLGTYDTRREALKRLRQIRIIRYLNRVFSSLGVKEGI
jgi:hypothetical protein